MLWNGKAANKNCYTWMNFNLSGASINIAIAKVKFIDGASLQIVIGHLCCDWTPNLFTKWMNIINYIEQFLV